MKDQDCVHFLQWALPQLHMRWPGFRRVRGQVCKRLQRRTDELQLDGLDAYRDHLNQHDEEWPRLDSLCQVTVSRFYRDKAVFAFLEEQVLPTLIGKIEETAGTEMKIWSAGCGAGEEPYTLALLWALRFQSSYAHIEPAIMATDINPDMLERARQACYPFSAIKNLPLLWRESAFVKRNEMYCLRHEYQTKVEFVHHDLRSASLPDEAKNPCHLICCRNLAFTYFDDSLQREVAQRLHSALHESGVLILGVHEELPAGVEGFKVWSKRLAVYRRVP